MDLKKLFMGGIVGGILYFVLGWLIYGMLLKDFMANHTGAAGNVMKPEPDMLYLAVGNLVLGLLMAYIFVKSNVNSLASGLVTGGIIGLLMAVGYDCTIYATSTIMSKTAMAADVAVSAVMSAIVGAVVGMIIGMGRKEA